MAMPLNDALAACRVAFDGLAPDALLWDLGFDAVWVRARHGELSACTPRLLELVATDRCGDTAPWEVFATLADDGWPEWDEPRRSAIGAFADAWWATLLRFHPYPPGVDDVLVALAQLDLSLIRWLHPFVEQFDGPGAEHLADLVLGGLSSAGWERRADERGQIEAWTRTEPVVMGVALVGGVHLDNGRFGDVLDRILEAP